MLTTEQRDRIKTMSPEDAKGWVVYYEERNAKASDAIKGLLANAKEIEPREALKASGLPAMEFASVVRRMKMVGLIRFTESGTMQAWQM